MTSTTTDIDSQIILAPHRVCAGWISVLNLRSFLALLALSIFPGAASAFTIEALNIGRPGLIIPIVLGLEIPFAIWISGALGAEDRRTIKATFTTILSHDFSNMTADEIMTTIFWGENSIIVFIFRIWLAVVAAMLCTITFGQIEPALMTRFEMPSLMVLIISFSLFSYVFIRNLCEETIRDQIGHACLASVFSAAIFAGVYYLV